jgi:hypothetical protein
MLVDVSHTTEEEIEPASFIRDPAEKPKPPRLRTAENPVRMVRAPVSCLDEAADRRVYLNAFAELFGPK